jgi:hypothetical protein
MLPLEIAADVGQGRLMPLAAPKAIWVWALIWYAIAPHPLVLNAVKHGARLVVVVACPYGTYMVSERGGSSCRAGLKDTAADNCWAVWQAVAEQK